MRLRSSTALSSLEFWAVGLAAMALTALRILTMAPDPWEWDEVLFTNAAERGLDVRINQPHSPGFPVYVFAARGLVLCGVAPFHAAAAVALIGGLIAALGCGFAYRSAGGSARFGLFSAVLFAFLPSVWVHSVRPLSDAPGAGTFLVALAVLFLSIREQSTRWLLAGALLPALAAGVRPQAGLALLPVAAVAAWVVFRRHGVRPVLMALATGLIASLVIWVPAVLLSGGLRAWLGALRIQMEWVKLNDSPGFRDFALATFWTRWLLDPFGSRLLALCVWGLALSSFAIRARRAAGLLVSFIPLFLLSVCVLAAHTAPRYAMTLLALPCLLAAVALEGIAMKWGRNWLVALGATGVLALSAATALPPVLRTSWTPSPPAALMHHLTKDRSWALRPLAIDPALQVHVERYLGRRSVRRFPSFGMLPPRPDEVFLSSDGSFIGPAAIARFSYGEPSLFRICRARYLQTAAYDARDGAVPHFLRFFSGAAWDDETYSAVLPAGAAVEIYVASPEARATVQLTSSGGAVVFVTRFQEEPSQIRLLPGIPAESEWTAKPRAPSYFAFRIESRQGSVRAVISRLVGLAPGKPPVFDDAIPVSVDFPVDGASVKGPIRASGWCQERGGMTVSPVEFLVDGALIPGVRVVRGPRADVAAALPELAPAALAGFQAELPDGVVPAGNRSLAVVFEAADGRRRVYPAVKINVLP